MPRNRVCQPRPQHDERMLALILRGACGATDGVVQAPQGAAGAGIQIAHTAHYDVSLVVEIEAVVDQFVEIDLGRTFHAAVATRTSTAVAMPSAITAWSAWTTTAISASITTWTSTLAWRAIASSSITL